MDEMKRERMVAYLRHRMAEFGIKPEDLAPDPVAAPAVVKAPGVDRYRSANGERWDGEGEMPDWLRRAISAGQSIDHFEVAPARRTPAGQQAS
ncbi:H-NS family nucleoid-associated regulatory protein [Paraburkholderia sp.]|jgi:DNA-binding protein H-NS|uniref:H-NS family nucleoid-associated regulatory protein n=1 Tax=Paraburkholderia sp. TaxID=1926495 RepID=UPI002F3FA4AF